jgi:phospholipase/carboxylesterase
VLGAGEPLSSARAAMVLVHGRGASAESILTLAPELAQPGFAYLAPQAAGIPPERTILLGFSQGACLATEFAARNARRYGGVIGLSGGLIGPDGTPRSYAGALAGTPVFLGCSDVDSHIPLARVHESTEVLRALGGDVTEIIYPGMDHTIVQDEIDHVEKILRGVGAPTDR